MIFVFKGSQKSLKGTRLASLLSKNNIAIFVLQKEYP